MFSENSKSFKASMSSASANEVLITIGRILKGQASEQWSGNIMQNISILGRLVSSDGWPLHLQAKRLHHKEQMDPVLQISGMRCLHPLYVKLFQHSQDSTSSVSETVI